MSQTDAGWGAAPSALYEELAGSVRPVFGGIRAGAVTREHAHRLPQSEIVALRQSGFSTLRLARNEGGLGASLPERFDQLVHLATLAGIGRCGDDPQVQQVVGRVRGAACAAGAIVLKAAESLQRTDEAHRAGEATEHSAADVEVNQAVRLVANLVLEATTILLDALGASAVMRGLDRHWRNARTIASHDPRIYRDRTLGDFAVNGTA